MYDSGALNSFRSRKDSQVQVAITLVRSLTAQILLEWSVRMEDYQIKLELFHQKVFPCMTRKHRDKSQDAQVEYLAIQRCGTAHE